MRQKTKSATRLPGPDMKNIGTSVSTDTWQKMRIHCTVQNITQQQFLHDVIVEFFKSHDRQTGRN